jgi:hypothetical protein
MDEIIQMPEPDLGTEAHESEDPSVGAQIHRNLVALISLAIAISSFGYNSWRNEQTEANRNIRDGGFYLLRELGQLQLIVDRGHYRRDEDAGDPINGWNRVILIQDMAMLMPESVQYEAQELFEVWGSEWQAIGADIDGVERITAQVDATREAVRRELSALR